MYLIRAGGGVLWTAACLSALGGCASTRMATEAEARPLIVTMRDGSGAYRFDMSQGGRRMTADEFDAWMKANGIRIAKGAPSGSATRKAKPGVKPKAAATRTVAPRRVASAATGG